MRKAFLTGLGTTDLSPNEAAFLGSEKPAGIILFARNIDNPYQVARLVADARSAIGSADVLVLIDQEGGRVQRLMPPHWRLLPSAGSFAKRHATDSAGAEDALRQITGLTAGDLRALGVNVNCVPCADVPVSGAHDIIGTRAYGQDVATIVRLAGIVAEAAMAAGMLPVLKHIPGHGRAMVDSHLALPVVEAPREELAVTDFAAFRALNSLPAAMTAHVVYAAIDPDQPATTSRRVIREIIRGDIGFQGLLMTDDLSMQALNGPVGERTKAAISAGCDLALHCNGDFSEMRAVADATPELRGDALRRFEACAKIVARTPFPLDIQVAEGVLAEHMEKFVGAPGKLA